MINFNFESATVADLPAGQWEFVSAKEGLPGWSVYFGTNPVTRVTHNLVSLGAANVGLLGPNLDTRYLLDHSTAVLQAGTDMNGELVAATIEQTGLVPLSALSLRFQTGKNPGNNLDQNYFSVTIDGQAVPVWLLGTTSTRYYWGTDISQFAGRSASLSISSLPVNYPANGGFTLDNISFGSSIPEPSASGLLAVGALLLSWLRIRKQP